MCGICGVSLQRHQPCSVCFSTNAHTRLCSFCHAQHRELGIDWSETDGAELGGDAGDVGSDERILPVVSFSELAGRTRRRRSAKKLTLVMQLLLLREQMIEVRRVDSRGRLRGVYYRREPLSRRGVARRVGCSHTYVNRIFRQHVPCTNRVARG